MSVLDPLRTVARPALYGAGHRSSQTEGDTWYWPFLIRDPATLAAIDVSTGVTASCSVWDAATLVPITTLVVTLGNGTIAVSKAKADTVNLAAGNSAGRLCRWGLYLDDSTTRIHCWMPTNSFLTIHETDLVA